MEVAIKNMDSAFTWPSNNNKNWRVTSTRLDLQLHVQSVLVTIKNVRFTPPHGQVHSIQHYVIKFVCELPHVGGFLWVLRFIPPIKLTDRYNWTIVESGV